MTVVAVEPAVRVVCDHCGLDVPRALVEEGAALQFCCSGCRTVYALLHERGLDKYYRLPERRLAPVSPSDRSFAEFDHPAFHELYVSSNGAGLSRTELYLEGVHCASCVWLVERTPLVMPGVIRAELNVRTSRATVEWDSSRASLSEVARALDQLGYTPHPFRGVEREAMRRREDRAMLARIGVAGAIAVNVMLASLALYSGWLGGMEAEWERFFRWVSLLLVTPALLWPGSVFFRGAWGALRTRSLHMDVPIALGLAAGYLRGAINTVQDAGPIYFDGLATLVFVLLVGRYLQQRGQRAAADSSELLFSMVPKRARVVEGDAVHDVPAEGLVPGMLLDVRAGEMLAADGRVEQGESRFDLSLLTGESRPCAVQKGDVVYAGTLNLSAPIRVRVERAGEASRVARLLRSVEESAARRAPVVQTANRMAGYFVAIVLLLAAATFVVWQGLDPSRAWDNAIALLVVTCPCALALSTPLAVSVAIGAAARRGILIKGGDALELLARPARILLDKTGTITEARTSVEAWFGDEWVKPLVLALEEGSNHPVASAFRNAWGGSASGARTDSIAATEAHHVFGGGIAGVVGGHRVLIGNPVFVAAQLGFSGPAANILRTFPPLRADLTPVLVAVDGEVRALAGIGDTIRRGARESVADLVRRGWRVGILSGDDQLVVSAVADAVGVARSEAVGAATPEEKLAIVERAAGDTVVVMIGDGVNDAAAIARASVGIGVHGGAEASLESSDVYLARAGLAPVVELVDGAARTMRVIKRSIAFSLAYNVVGASLAMAGVLSPLIAAILMPASSLTVVLSAWRSRTFGEVAR